MDSMNNKYFNNPLPYVFIVFILSYFSYEMYSKNAILASFYVISFFIFIMYITLNFNRIYLIIAHHKKRHLHINKCLFTTY